MKTALALLTAGALLPLAAHAALPDYDPFGDATGSGGTSYAAGSNLAGQTDAQGQTWYATGSAAGTPIISAGSLSIDGLAASQGNMVSFGPPPVNGGTSARLGLGTTVNSGTLYYSLALQVTSLGALPTTGAFIAGFNNSTGAQATQASVIGARLYTRLSGTGFNLGINKADGTGADITWDSAVHSAGETLFIVGSYTFGPSAGDDVTSLWINPDSSTFGGATAPGATISASAGTDIGGNQIASFLLREASTLEPNVLLDELRVGTSWADVTPPAVVPEPGVGALSALGMALLAWRWRLARR